MIGKLGKDRRVDDPRNLKVGAYINRARMRDPLPISCSWSVGVDAWGMFLNDELKCCLIAAAGHAIQTWSAHAGAPMRLSNDDVQEAYRAISGYDGTEETDVGSTMNQLLKRWRTYGIGGVEILAWVEVDPRDHFQVAATIDLCGGVLCGFQLPRSIERETIWRETWDRPGSLGGHAIWIPDRSFFTRDGPSWQRKRQLTLEFFDRYCDECYGLVSELWLGRDLVAPNGLRLDQLLRDVKRVTS